MLVLSRHRDESIMIGHNVMITVVDVRGDKVRLGIIAPQELPVHRKEVYEQVFSADDPRRELLRPDGSDSGAGPTS